MSPAKPNPSGATANADWIYNQQVGIYRKGNRGITPRRLIEVRNETVAGSTAASDGLAAQVSTGQISVQTWTTQMRAAIKEAYTQQYVLARGGINNMTQADWGRLGGALREQYQYLDRFAQEITMGRLSPAQIQSRARLYMNSATQAFERGKAAGKGLVLPAYPGDGSTQCRTNCKCRWDIRETSGAYYCRWLLGVAEHCPDCVTNAGRWNPLVIAR